MSDYEKLFFPFHYKWLSMTKELSDADFGILVRAVLGGFITGTDEPEDLPKELVIPFRFIKDAAERVVEHRKKVGETGRRLAEKRWGDKADVSADDKPKKEGGFGKIGSKLTDAEINETFERALKRTYDKPNEERESQ